MCKAFPQPPLVIRLPRLRRRSGHARVNLILRRRRGRYVRWRGLGDATVGGRPIERATRHQTEPPAQLPYDMQRTARALERVMLTALGGRSVTRSVKMNEERKVHDSTRRTYGSDHRPRHCSGMRPPSQNAPDQAWIGPLCPHHSFPDPQYAQHPARMIQKIGIQAADIEVDTRRRAMNTEPTSPANGSQPARGWIRTCEPPGSRR